MPRLLRVMRWLTATATVIILLLLAWQCIDIYLDGNSSANLDANGVHISNVYSMDDVILRVRSIALPLFLCGTLVLATTLLHFFVNKGTSVRHSLTAENQLRLLKARVAELPDAAKTEERVRFIVICCTLVILLVEAGFCLSYLLDRAHFTSWDLEMVMGNMMLNVAPHVLVSFMGLMIVSVIRKGSIQREITALKAAPKSAPAAAKSKKVFPLIPVRIVLYALAVLFIVLGVMNGGLRDVLVKAINICTECIGLG